MEWRILNGSFFLQTTADSAVQLKKVVLGNGYPLTQQLPTNLVSVRERERSWSFVNIIPNGCGFRYRTIRDLRIGCTIALTRVYMRGKVRIRMQCVWRMQL